MAFPTSASVFFIDSLVSSDNSQPGTAIIQHDGDKEGDLFNVKESVKEDTHPELSAK